MSELDKDKLKYVAGGQSADGLPEKLKDAIKAYEDMLNSVPEAEKPTDRNDKDGWKAW